MHKALIFSTILFVLRFNVMSQTNNDQKKILVDKLFAKAVKIEGERPDSAIKLYEEAIKVMNNDYTIKNVAICLHRISEIHSALSNTDKAVHFQMEALKCFENQNDSARSVVALLELAALFMEQRLYDNCKTYSERAGDMAKIIGADSLYVDYLIQKANIFQNLAVIEKNLSLIDSAINYLKEGLILAKSKNGISKYGTVLCNLGNTYFNKGDYTEKIEYYRQASKYSREAIEFLKTHTRIEELAYSYGLLGAAEMKLGNYASSENAYLEAISIYKKNKSNYFLKLLYSEMTSLYIKSNQNDKAIESFFYHDSLSKLVLDEANTKNVSEMQTKYETDKKEQQNIFLSTKNELSAKTIQQQKITTYFIIIGLILSLLLTVFIFRGLKQQRKANKIISEQKHEVELQKHIVDEKQKEILDSITYARRIQRSLLPTEKYIERKLKSKL